MTITEQLPTTDRPLGDDRLAELTTGVDYWTTAAAPEVGLRSLRLADGPHGLRVQDDENPDHLGLNRSKPATCFPPAVTLASSWDPSLAREVGAALGREARAAGVDVVLGPGLNLKRSPLCGRNFEYFSEDPLLSGIMAGAVVTGLQSRGVAACVKHFAVNNQETDRQRVSAEVDERTLRELYLRTFQIAIREGNPWSVMSSYNKINGVYASENHWLLTEVLRDEWGYDGVVVSDWGAVHEPVEAVAAGTDLRMPGRPEDDRVRQALASGALDRADARRTADRIALLAERTSSDAPVEEIDFPAHHELTRRAAAESAVLLTNDGTLPLAWAMTPTLAVIGELARAPRYQGAGSSAVNPVQLVSGWDALAERAAAAGTEVRFAAGYSLEPGDTDATVIEEAVSRVVAADAAVLFLGLPGRSEAEGRDRSHIDLPADQLALLEALAGVDTPVVVALSNGSAVTTAAWRGDVNAIVEFWLTGQAHGETVADVLFGDVNPSGKLAETIPVRLQDSPAFLDFPGENSRVHYGEGIYVGYRWYDARDIAVDHAFGHGLSYTTFELSALDVETHVEADPVALTVSLTVRNTGERDGAEVVQVYVGDEADTVITPERELRGFQKVFLAAGESRRVTIRIARADLEHFSTAVSDWVYEGGRLTVSVGTSSRELPLSAELELAGSRVVPPLTEWATLGEWQSHPVVGGHLAALLAERGGIKGRMADLLGDETGRDSVLDLPMHTLVEFPGVPLKPSDLDELIAITAV